MSNDGKNPRNILLNFSVNPGSELSFTFDEVLQSLQVNVKNPMKDIKPTEVIVSTYYERPKKIKVLNEIAHKISDFHINLDESLHKYNVILGIDTSYKILDGVKKCVSCVFNLRIYKDQPIISSVVAYVFNLDENSENPERYAWKLLIEQLLSSKTYSPTYKFGIVTDSELGNLQKYNSREKNIIDDFTLPKNFELIYASAERGGNEYLVNSLIKYTDREAAKLLDQFIKEDFHFPSIGNPLCIKGDSMTR